MKQFNYRYFIFIIIIILLIGLYFYTHYSYQYNKNTEYFENNAIQNVSSNKIYDKFYSKIYDQLFFSAPKLNYEIAQIKRHLSKSKSKILDIGCGTGQHLQRLKNYNITGLDNSNDMLQVAKTKVPKLRLIKGNASNSNLFDHQQFNVLLVLYFVIYYQKDISKFLQNCYKWLDKNGLLVVHLVNPDKFDPILEPSSPFPGFSVQKYSNKRVTKSNVVFNNFDYEANFDLNLDTNKAVFKEEIKFKKDGRIRRQTHHLTIPPIKGLLKQFKKYGFEYKEHLDLMLCGYEYQYLYYFTKK